MNNGVVKERTINERFGSLREMKNDRFLKTNEIRKNERFKIV